MSQPSTPFSGVDDNPFFPSFHQQQQLLTQGDLDDLFSSSGSDQPVFSSNNSETFDDPDFSFDDASVAQINTSTASNGPNPDFSQYNFGDAFTVCPSPDTKPQHLYSVDTRQSSRVLGNPHTIPPSHRAPYLRSHTNSPCPHPAQPSVRRRSLSQGDADRVAAANTIANPTFVRLQAPRSRSTTPEEKRRGSPYARHARSASQGPSPRGRPLKTPSAPYGLHGSPLLGGMLSMPIGTPLDDVIEVEDSGSAEHASKFDQRHSQKDVQSLSLYAKADGPAIRQIDHPNDLAKSRQIIQIGAMALRSSPGLDPKLLTEPSSTHHERILKKLDDIEHHLSLENGYSSDALRGCTMIREALANKTEMDLKLRAASADVQRDSLDAPSMVYSEMDCDVYDGANEDDEFMQLLMQDIIKQSG